MTVPPRLFTAWPYSLSHSQIRTATVRLNKPLMMHSLTRSALITALQPLRICSFKSQPTTYRTNHLPSPSVPDNRRVDAPIFDFSNTPVARDYKGYYVKVLDDVFTPKECAELIALAESDREWTQAAVGGNPKNIRPTYRLGQRILRFDPKTADKIYQRLLPCVQEVVKIQPGDKWAGIVGRRGNFGTWEMVGVNERLSYLRYEKGGFFKPHCDYLKQLPDGRIARITIQIYLGEDGVEGGATRIWGSGEKYFDVRPKKGRVLIFQHKGLKHSGDDVTKGVKYTLRSEFMFRVKKADQ